VLQDIVLVDSIGAVHVELSVQGVEDLPAAQRRLREALEDGLTAPATLDVEGNMVFLGFEGAKGVSVGLVVDLDLLEKFAQVQYFPSHGEPGAPP
jgi:hypothetical protein